MKQTLNLKSLSFLLSLKICSNKETNIISFKRCFVNSRASILFFICIYNLVLYDDIILLHKVGAKKTYLSTVLGLHASDSIVFTALPIIIQQEMLA